MSAANNQERARAHDARQGLRPAEREAQAAVAAEPVTCAFDRPSRSDPRRRGSGAEAALDEEMTATALHIDLDRLQRAAPAAKSPPPGTVNGHERFAAYVAHELRTPLATQRALLELALTDPSTDAVAWHEIANDVLESCKQQERLLERLLDNLLTNAVTHNSIGGWIEVTTRSADEHALFTVENAGAPIPRRTHAAVRTLPATYVADQPPPGRTWARTRDHQGSRRCTPRSYHRPRPPVRRTPDRRRLSPQQVVPLG